MAKKAKKEKGSRKIKQDRQISISKIRPMKIYGPRYFLQRAREYPILGCWIQEDWNETGITPVVIARLQDPEKVLFCNCLVDTYCLGVKDCFTETDLLLENFKKQLSIICNDAPKECTPEFAHEMIYGAIEFAARYGFQPHRDFTRQMADLILDPPDAYPRKNKIKFGYKGKPLYIAGPNEDEFKIKNIIDTLTRTAGAGKFDYLVGFDSLDSFDPT